MFNTIKKYSGLCVSLLMLVSVLVCCDSNASRRRDNIPQVKIPKLKPLTEYPRVSHLNEPDEIACYKSKEIWNPELTLDQNKERLLDIFFRECVDFVSYTYLSSPTKTLFFAVTEPEKEIIIDLTLPIKGRLRSLLQVYPDKLGIFWESSEVYPALPKKDAITGIFRTLAENPLGCELMRVVISKVRTGKMEKMIFLETNRFTHGIVFPSAKMLEDVLSAQKSGNIGADLHKSSVIFFPSSLVVKSGIMLKFDSDALQYLGIPIEAAFFHEVLHAIPHEASIHTEVIEKRYTEFRLLTINFDDDSHIDALSVWKQLLDSDEEYLVMYGLGKKGLNLLNESAYLICKYGMMSFCHANFVQDERTKEIFRPNLQAILATNIVDNSLHHFYLKYLKGILDLAPRRRASALKRLGFPQFGDENYPCAGIEKK